MFERKGCIIVNTQEQDKVKKELGSRGLKIESSSLEWVAKENIEIDEKNKQSCHELFELLDENDSVQEIYSNFSF